MVLYGPPGVGKTSFAAQFPGAGFIIDPQEQGINRLLAFNRCPQPVMIEEVDTFQGLMETCAKVAGGKYPGLETLFIDSLIGMEKLCFIHHCDEHFDGDWSREGFYSYQQGPKNAAKTDWPLFLEMMDAVNHADINVCLIGHSKVKNYQNPEGPDYDRFIVTVDKETWEITSRWSGAVMFYNYHVDLDKSRRSGTKVKAKGEEQRMFFTEWSPAFDAKNQFGLPTIIPAGESAEEAFSNFKQEYLNC